MIRLGGVRDSSICFSNIGVDVVQGTVSFHGTADTLVKSEENILKIDIMNSASGGA